MKHLKQCLLAITLILSWLNSTYPSSKNDLFQHFKSTGKIATLGIGALAYWRILYNDPIAQIRYLLNLNNEIDKGLNKYDDVTPEVKDFVVNALSLKGFNPSNLVIKLDKAGTWSTYVTSQYYYLGVDRGIPLDIILVDRKGIQQELDKAIADQDVKTQKLKQEQLYYNTQFLLRAIAKAQHEAVHMMHRDSNKSSYLNLCLPLIIEGVSYGIYKFLPSYFKPKSMLGFIAMLIPASILKSKIHSSLIAFCRRSHEYRADDGIIDNIPLLEAIHEEYAERAQGERSLQLTDTHPTCKSRADRFMTRIKTLKQTENSSYNDDLLKEFKN